MSGSTCRNRASTRSSVQGLLGLAGASAVPLLDVHLGYSQSNGTDLLRERIAALYPGASPEQVLVTNGSSEANFAICWRLLEPGDKVAIMLPNYLQTWGLTQNFGAVVRGFPLHEEQRWEPTPEEIRARSRRARNSSSSPTPTTRPDRC